MFGYVRADLSKLNEESAEQYRTVYCTLCHTLKKHYGNFSRLLLNYDVTFLALVLLNRNNASAHCSQKWCPVKMKHCRILEENEQIFFYCASVLIILAYEKVLDNILDEPFWKKPFYLFLKILLGGQYRKAKRQFSDLCDKVRQNMIAQSVVEKGSASPDRSAQQTADSLGWIFSYVTQEEAYYRFGYMLGRWIYFIDAADDRENDRKQRRFNPFAGEVPPEKIMEILNHSIGEAVQAWQMLPKGQWSPIIENILFEGTYKAQNVVLKGEDIESV